VLKTDWQKNEPNGNEPEMLLQLLTKSKAGPWDRIRLVFQFSFRFMEVLRKNNIFCRDATLKEPFDDLNLLEISKEGHD